MFRRSWGSEEEEPVVAGIATFMFGQRFVPGNEPSIWWNIGHAWLRGGATVLRAYAEGDLMPCALHDREGRVKIWTCLIEYVRGLEELLRLLAEGRVPGALLTSEVPGAVLPIYGSPSWILGNAFARTLSRYLDMAVQHGPSPSAYLQAGACLVRAAVSAEDDLRVYPRPGKGDSATATGLSALALEQGASTASLARLWCEQRGREVILTSLAWELDPGRTPLSIVCGSLHVRPTPPLAAVDEALCALDPSGCFMAQTASLVRAMSVEGQGDSLEGSLTPGPAALPPLSLMSGGGALAKVQALADAVDPSGFLGREAAELATERSPGWHWLARVNAALATGGAPPTLVRHNPPLPLPLDWSEWAEEFRGDVDALDPDLLSWSAVRQGDLKFDEREQREAGRLRVGLVAHIGARSMLGEAERQLVRLLVAYDVNPGHALPLVLAAVRNLGGGQTSPRSFSTWLPSRGAGRRCLLLQRCSGVSTRTWWTARAHKPWRSCARGRPRVGGARGRRGASAPRTSSPSS